MIISVCMAVFNGEKYIAQQLQSVLEQLGEQDEIIITDDHSTDQTTQIIEEFKDTRIKLYHNVENLGYTRNFERALSLSNGEVIFLCDQDDVWLPGKVKAVLEKLQGCDMVVTNACIVDAELKVIHPSHFAKHKMRPGFWINFAKSRYIGACMAFRRAVLLKALPFPKVAEKAPHDIWLTLIGEWFFNLELIEEPYLLYRRHGGNASGGGLISNIPFTKRINHRIYRFSQLVKRMM